MLKHDIFKNKDKVLDDIARVAGGTVTVMSGITQNIRNDIKARADELGERLNWVPREDFERLELIVQEQAKKIEALENALKPKAVKSKTVKTNKKTKA